MIIGHRLRHVKIYSEPGAPPPNECTKGHLGMLLEAYLLGEKKIEILNAEGIGKGKIH